MRNERNVLGEIWMRANKRGWGWVVCMCVCVVLECILLWQKAEIAVWTVALWLARANWVNTGSFILILGTGLSNLYKWEDVVNVFYSREVGAKCLSQQWRQTVSQNKEVIMSAAAFLLHILKANINLLNLEKRNVQ